MANLDARLLAWSLFDEIRLAAYPYGARGSAKIWGGLGSKH